MLTFEADVAAGINECKCTALTACESSYDGEDEVTIVAYDACCYDEPEETFSHLLVAEYMWVDPKT